ncbi:splA [Symbiodinium natans]|uniref:SplA protein n=1 Tax=Symbiodinium natans TaxID=878477 RepID=A0A812L190_9DINO|nr:splA [Symbiodinium natans]
MVAMQSPTLMACSLLLAFLAVEVSGSEAQVPTMAKCPVMLQSQAASLAADTVAEAEDTGDLSTERQPVPAELVQTSRKDARDTAHQTPVQEFSIDKPSGRVVDINIGTNFSPMRAEGNNFLVLVDPLPDVCEYLRKGSHSNTDVAVLCCAVSNYTGHATFRRYNRDGLSSSLSSTTAGTTHARFPVEDEITVVVLEAATVLRGYLARKNTLHKLKTDMQGMDLTTLRNLEPILSMPDQVPHLMSECCFPDDQGRQVYQIDNDCKAMVAYLQSLGYTTKFEADSAMDRAGWGNVYAYKHPATTFLRTEAWAGSRSA